MIVYHGSYMPIEKPRLITSEYGKDFGFGFYTTDILVQAERWAMRIATMRRRKNESFLPTVSIFEFNDTLAKQDLSVKVFTEPSLEWLEFILACRSDVNFKHEYDITIGNIANDNVGETVSFVQSGIMRKEDAVERLRFQKINNQICFNTTKAIQYLSFIKSEVVGS